jgi:hypothetical protein
MTQVAGGSVDLKQLIAPVLICLGASFETGADLIPAAQLVDAHTPAVPVRDLLCVRLV